MSVMCHHPAEAPEARPGGYALNMLCCSGSCAPPTLQLSAWEEAVKFGITRIARLARGVPPTPVSWTD